jgi:hypothetical protein
MTYTPYGKKRRYQYKPETIIKRRINAAKFLTKCMVNQADEKGFCIVLAKQECEKTYKDGRIETFSAREVDMTSLEFALDAEKQGLCEILYNPFMPAITGVPNNEKVLNYYIERSLRDLEKNQGEKEIIQ